MGGSSQVLVSNLIDLGYRQGYPQTLQCHLLLRWTTSTVDKQPAKHSNYVDSKRENNIPCSSFQEVEEAFVCTCVCVCVCVCV